MTFSRNITLSLLLAGASAQNIIPYFATGTVTPIKYASDVYAIAVGEGDTEKKVVANVVDGDSANHNSGLYGCLMSELESYATQGFAMTLGNNAAAAVDTQESGSRTYWGYTAAHQGAFALDGTMDTQAEVDGKSFFDCCTAGALDITDEATYEQCPSAVALNLDGSAAIDFAGAAPTDLLNRINFIVSGQQQTQVGGNPITQSAFTWDSDFLLASQAQLNAVDSSTYGFCSGEWRTVMTSDAAQALEATEGFNSNTKCTWQIQAKEGSAPSFQVTEAPTSQFLVHFIEWADEKVAADTLFATGDLLPADNSASDYDFGEYDTADGVFFNPMSSASIDSGNAALAFGQDTNQFTKVERANSDAENSYYPGTPLGMWNIYAAGSSPFDDADTQLASDDRLFMSGVQAALTAAKSVYSEWEDALADYNDEADSYNDDVSTYNDWVADEDRDEDAEPEVPERPCPPGDIEAIAAVEPYYNADDAFDITDFASRSFVAEYVVNDSNMDDIADSWSHGYIKTAGDFNNSGDDDYSGEYETSQYAAKIFGRFGQGEMNTPGMLPPLRFDDVDDSGDLVQNLMVSIFPTVGTSWNGGDAIDSDNICIEVSGAALSWTEVLYVPSASGSATDLDDTTFAKVLGASAMVMAASIAALY